MIDEHFIVETDERKRSRLRFGNGVNGARLSDTAVVVCDYQVGQGAVGNVGADSLTGFEALTDLNTLRNPFDVINGRDSEPVAEIIRRVPVAYRARQLRAVTLADYVQRAEELPEVAHAMRVTVGREAGVPSGWRSTRPVPPYSTISCAGAFRHTWMPFV